MAEKGERNEYMREYMREYRAAKKAARLASGGAPGQMDAPTSIRAARIKKAVKTGQEIEYTEQMSGGALIAWLLVGAVVIGVMAFAAWRIKNAPPLTPDELERRRRALEWINANRAQEGQADTTEQGQESTEPGSDTTEQGQEREEI